VTRAKQEIIAADIASYIRMVNYPEISKHNLNALSPSMTPFKFEDAHLTADITWRDGGIHEDLALAKIRGKWNIKMFASRNSR